METPHMNKTLTIEQKSLPDELKIGLDNKIVCTTCHNIHKNDQDSKLLKLSMQDSGICLACHQVKKSIVGTQHDLRTSAPNVLNILGETASESGECSSCHLIHPISDKNDLWAQKPLLQDNYGNELCTSCHSKDQNSIAHLPRYINHPDVTLLNRTNPGQNEYMPTFDKTRKLSRTGNISCLTCHEPHAGSSVVDTKEASSLHSRMFLRPAGSNGICADCHGKEALWRFLFYHREQRSPYIERK